MAININAAVEPMVPKLAQAGAPMLAQHDAEFVQQTQALWWRCAGTRRTWVYPDPDVAPWVLTSTLGSYVDFAVGSASINADLALPWMFQKGVDGLALLVTFAMPNIATRASMQATITAIGSAITDKTCPAVAGQLLGGSPPGLWTRRSAAWQTYVANLRFTGITTDNMDADRLASLTLSLNLDYRTDPDNLNITHEARIYAIHAYDIFSTPDPEDEA